MLGLASVHHTATYPDSTRLMLRGTPHMCPAGYAVTTALGMARSDNVTWLMHLDPDELLHPGASHEAGVLAGSYSLLPELCHAPAHVPSIR